MIAHLIDNNRQSPQPPAPPARPALPAPATTGAATTFPVTAPGDPMFQKLQWLKAQLGALLNQAARGKDPELYAEVMLDNLPTFVTAISIG